MFGRSQLSSLGIPANAGEALALSTLEIFADGSEASDLSSLEIAATGGKALALSTFGIFANDVEASAPSH